MAIRIAQSAPVTFTPVTEPKPRNAVIVTGEQQRIADLEARVAKLEALMTANQSDKTSRAEYMREYRKRKSQDR